MQKAAALTPLLTLPETLHEAGTPNPACTAAAANSKRSRNRGPDGPGYTSRSSIPARDRVIPMRPIFHRQHHLKRAYTTPKPTHLCGRLPQPSDPTSNVRISGWLESLRVLSSRLAFAVVRDASGRAQVRVASPAAVAELKKVNLESIVSFFGRVAKQPTTLNHAAGSPRFELHSEQVEVLNQCARAPPLPYHRAEITVSSESLRARYRYLDLRQPDLQAAIAARSRTVAAIYAYFARPRSRPFTHVETPTLFRPTPEGAREFLVPVAGGRAAYALAQSPQLFKQLLMAGGIDHYFQIARCYRAEDGRADRQPEFTQIDIEMAYADEPDVMAVAEDLIRDMYVACCERALPSAPFPVLSHAVALKRYGSDKPDLRRPWVIEGPDGEGGYWVRLEGLRELACDELAVLTRKRNGADTPTASGTSPVELRCHPQASGEPVIWAQAIDVTQAWRALGEAMRCAAALDPLPPSHPPAILWIVDFPLFEADSGACAWRSVHHPFTAPRLSEEELAIADPGSATARAYDLVINGAEIASGSIRIHRRGLQERILRDVLRVEDLSGLQPLLQALEFGCPPHGGIAIGLDRAVATFLGRASIRDVIAFPKNSQGRDTMAGAPIEL